MYYSLDINEYVLIVDDDLYPTNSWKIKTWIPTAFYTLACFYTMTVYTNIYGRCKVPYVRVYSESSISYIPINERALRIAEGHNDLDLRGILDSHDSYPRVQASRVGEQ